MNQGDVMNTLVKALVLSISTAFVAAPVMAAPQDHHAQQNNHQVQQQHNKAPAQHQIQKQNTHQKPAMNHQTQQQKYSKHQSTDPSRDWKVGQKVPSQYHNSSYKVDYSKYKKLHKPARNQQWIKVNGDYVLTNVISHAIVKIIAG